MDKRTQTLLGLEAYRIVGTKRLSPEEEEVQVALAPASPCPGCGRPTGTVHQRATRPSRVLWSFVNGRRLWLVVRRRRLRCAPCGRVFTQPLPGVAPRQRVSVVAQTALLGALAEQSFAAVARSYGISYGRAQRLLLRLPVPWCAWEELVGREGPIVLGIDEHSFRGKDLVITITCLSTHRLLTILPDDRQATLRRWLLALPQEVRSRVVAVCTDLREAFRKVVQQVLPQAVLVADHFHVIQDATRRLEETRRLEQSEAKTALPRWPLVKGQERLTPKQQAQLAVLQQRYPATIGEQHWLKEGLRQLYRCPDGPTATRHFRNLVLNAEEAEDASTVLWARTLRRWDKEILGYFQYRITNAYTEGCNTKVKLLKRLSYGFRNVEVYIRKMLLGFLPHSHEVLAPHILT